MATADDSPTLAPKCAHAEQWAPELLLALIAGKPLGAKEKELEQRAQDCFSPWSYLNPSHSANWQHMIGAALLWMDPAFPVDDSGSGPFPAQTITDWWLGLLQAQTGRLDTQDMFVYHGLSEPLSCIYEPMRWGAILAVRLLALRFPQNQRSAEILDLTTRYSEVLCCLLALGGAPWTDPGYQGNAGYWYDGPTFSPVSERSEAPGLQNDRGPLFCMATGWPLTVSKRETWAGQIGRMVAREGGFGQAPGFASAAGLLKGGPVAPVLESLAGIRLWAPQHFLSWPQGVLSYKPSRQNHNTPCIFWSWSDTNEKTMAIGWPWGEGRHRNDPQDGSCSIQGGEIVATVAQGTAAHAIPQTRPAWRVLADPQGVRPVPDPDPEPAPAPSGPPSP